MLSIILYVHIAINSRKQYEIFCFNALTIINYLMVSVQLFLQQTNSLFPLPSSEPQRMIWGKLLKHFEAKILKPAYRHKPVLFSDKTRFFSQSERVLHVYGNFNLAVINAIRTNQ